MPPSPRLDPTGWTRALTGPWAAAFVLGAFWLLMLASLRDKTVTFDEVGHVVSGRTYWSFNDYRLDPENGNLPQRVAAIPLTGERFRFPSLDSDAWRGSDFLPIGYEWLFKEGNDAGAMLAHGRAACSFFAVALGALVWLWSRRLNGPVGAMVSLVLFAASPTILANGALMTSDTAGALFLLASCAALWALLRRLTPLRLAASAAAMGCLFISKGSAVLIAPIALALAAARVADGRPLPVSFGRPREIPTRWGQAAAIAAAAIAHAVVVAAIIWSAYGFRFSAFAGPSDPRDHMYDTWEEQMGKPLLPTLLADLRLTPDQRSEVARLASERSVSFARWTPESLALVPVIESRVLTPDQARRLEGEMAASPPKLLFRAFDWIYRARLLPQSYLFGLAHVMDSTQVREAFMDGRYSLHGWLAFFPYTVLVKTPLPVFGVALLAAAAFLGRGRRGLTGGALPLWVLLAVYWAALLSAPINIGHRHVLAAYPPAFILCGAAADWLASRTRAIRGVLAALLLLLAAEVLWRFPDYLAYFNIVAGGPARGYRHLVDSSLDWGQDLPGVKRYLDEHRGTGPACLAYFGMGDPAYYRIPARLLSSFGFSLVDPVPLALLPVPVPAADPGAAIGRIAAANPSYEPFALAGDESQRVALFLRKPGADRLPAGTYFVSATLLQSLEYDLDGPWGPWNDRYEAAYRRLREKVEPLLEGDRGAREAAFGRDSVDGWLNTLFDYDQYRLARLAAFLRQREPDDSVGHSILVYRLTDADLARALGGPPPERGKDVAELLDAGTRLGGR